MDKSSSPFSRPRVAKAAGLTCFFLAVSAAVITLWAFQTRIEFVGYPKQSEVDFMIREVEQLAPGHVISGVRNLSHLASSNRIDRIRLEYKIIGYGGPDEERHEERVTYAHVFMKGGLHRLFLCRWDDVGIPIVTESRYLY